MALQEMPLQGRRRACREDSVNGMEEGCPCVEQDRIGPICILCGKAHLPDPSYLVLAGAVAYFAFVVVRYNLL